MEEFKKCKRDAKLLLDGQWHEWRLASVDEVKSNFAKIREKSILHSWDTVRLFDGCVEKYKCLKQYRPNMEDMLLVKTEISRPEDGPFLSEMYEKDPCQQSQTETLDTFQHGVQLREQGGEVALLLSCEDKITEVICFVLSRIVNNEAHTNNSTRSPNTNLQRDTNSLTKSLKEKFDTGRKVLQCAVEQQHNQKHPVQVAEFMMEIFKDEKELLKDGDIYGRTVLHFAAHRGSVGLCRFLIEDWKMRADETDINKEHVLHFSIKGKQKAVFDYLCELPEVQSIIGSPDAQGKTALHKAAAQGAQEMITTLLLHLQGEEKIRLIFIRKPDIFGQTALLEAARGGHVEAVKLLLNKGARPLHERNSDGRSALHYAVQLSNYQKTKDMAELLLNKCSSDIGDPFCCGLTQ